MFVLLINGFNRVRNPLVLLNSERFYRTNSFATGRIIILLVHNHLMVLPDLGLLFLLAGLPRLRLLCLTGRVDGDFDKRVVLLGEH